MANQVICSHCNSKNIQPTNKKNYVECKDCGGITDTRDWAAKFLGSAVGTGIAVLAVGLLPDEITDGIAEGVTDFMDDFMA